MLNINNAFINAVEANIIARKYMHFLENFILSQIEDAEEFKEEFGEEINSLYDAFTDELDAESSEGMARDWEEITDKETITENQIKKIYYELRKNKEKLSFADADNIIKILCWYNEEE